MLNKYFLLFLVIINLFHPIITPKGFNYEVIDYSSQIETDSGTIIGLKFSCNNSIYFISGNITVYYLLKIVDFGVNVSKIENLTLSLNLSIQSRNYFDSKIIELGDVLTSNKTFVGVTNFYISAWGLRLDYGERVVADIIYSIHFYERFENNSRSRLYIFENLAFSLTLVSKVRIFKNFIDIVLVLVSGTLIILLPLLMIELYRRRSKKRKIFVKYRGKFIK